MPQPKPSTVLLILALFFCVALYVLGVGLGAQDKTSSEDSGMSEQERKDLRTRLFGEPSSVTPGALKAKAGCSLFGDLVQVSREQGIRCVVDIAESDERLRTLKVEPQGGSVLKLELEMKGRAPVTITVEELKDSQEFNLLGAGATVTLECKTPVALGGCPVRLH
jgi:hypothetical protein